MFFFAYYFIGDKMNLKKLINDYVECGNFTIKYCNNKLYIYYYNQINNVTSKNIIITKNNINYSIKGNNLSLDEMFEETLVIKGDIKLVEMDEKVEK